MTDALTLTGSHLELFELFDCCLILLQANEHRRKFVARQRVEAVRCNGLLQSVQCGLRVTLLVVRHAQVALEDSGARVDGQGLLEVVHGKLVLLLPEVDLPDAVPAAVHGATSLANHTRPAQPFHREWCTGQPNSIGTQACCSHYAVPTLSCARPSYYMEA